MDSRKESVETQVSRIPKTGRIGRFAKIVEEETSQDVLLEIIPCYIGLLADQSLHLDLQRKEFIPCHQEEDREN